MLSSVNYNHLFSVNYSKRASISAREAALSINFRNLILMSFLNTTFTFEESKTGNEEK